MDAPPSSTPWSGPWSSVAELARLLRSVPEGRAVLEAAEKKDPTVLKRIKLGQASFTESTFSRTYSLVDGKEQFTLRHEITLSSRLKLADAVVDLAHELLHFSEKGMLDPYRPGFELEQFVRNGIEGEGGELPALEVECSVAWALERKDPSFPRHRLCERYRRKGDSFNRAAARRDYYSVGTWYRETKEALQGSIPELNQTGVVFTSSYAGKPYPVALVEEYAMTRRAACVNNRRKYRLIAAQAEGDRRPASVELMRERMRLKAYDRLYCDDLKSAATDLEVKD
jgi:hypothetical protein